MLWVYRRGSSRDTVGSIATTLLVVPALSSRCLWLNQTQYSGTARSATASTGSPFASNGSLNEKTLSASSSSSSSSAAADTKSLVDSKGLICGLDAGTPLAAAASRFAPTTPTCFLSIKPTATARASHRRSASARGRDPLARFGSSAVGFSQGPERGVKDLHLHLFYDKYSESEDAWNSPN